MNKPVMEAILEKIKAYDRILIFRHFRPDGDATGSTKGLQAILKLTFPEKEIYLQNDDFSAYMSFLGPEDAPLEDALYADALGIVLDTGTAQRISNQRYKLCKELIKIDHHIPVDAYAPLCWVEEERSSVCEMVACFYDTFRDQLKIDKEAATYIYAGMVTDSGRFQFRSVSGDTMRLAGMLLDQGIDTDTLYGHLYLRSFDELKFKACVYHNMEVTENGVAYILVTKEMQDTYGLSLETASTAVSFLENIEGCLCWLAFIETADEKKSVRVRLRSRFVPINTVAEQFRGGGHACASGATVYSQEELEALLADTDALVKEYKETHEGWL